MIQRITLLLLACLGLQSMANAQYCGTDYVRKQLMAKDPAYAGRVQQMTNSWHNWVAMHNATIPQGGSNNLVVNAPGTSNFHYEIPVVIHVIDTGGPIGSRYSPTDAQLLGMIDYLNQSYAATWSSYPDASSGGTPIPIKFVLAQRDINCNATTGILRVNGNGIAGYKDYGIKHEGVNGADELTIKALSIWDNTQYYNVWVVNKIDGLDGTAGTFVAGYAYLPPGIPASLDGTIMLATEATAGSITLPHEIAHALSVLHTFQGNDPSNTGANTCPANADCTTDGDQICDTEPEKQSVFNCPVDPNPCSATGVYNFVQHNFMDYSSCQDRFTAGQRTRMIFGLETYRGPLIGSLGGQAPGNNPIAAACTPATPTNNFNAGPREVKIKDANYVFLDYTSGGYNDEGNKEYLDRTCRQGVILLAGSTDTLSVTTGPTAEKVRVYIDYNNDGVFTTSNPNELVYSDNGTASNETHTFAYTVPTSLALPALQTCTPLRMRVVSDRAAVADPTACNLISGQAEDYTVTIQGTGSGIAGSATVSIVQLAGGNPSCNGSQVVFRAQPSSNVTSATYKWLVNGIATGVTADTFSTATAANKDRLTCKMYYTTQCGYDSTASIADTIHRAAAIAPTAAIALIQGNNPGCAVQLFEFQATGTNLGNTPQYSWMVNGQTKTSGAGLDNYTNSALQNGDIVSCTVTSSLTCAVPDSVTTGNITMSLSNGLVPSAIETISNGSNPGCMDEFIEFTGAATNLGNNPSYTWFVNGVAQSSGTVYGSNLFADGDTVTLRAYATDAGCYTMDSVDATAIVLSLAPKPVKPLISLIGNMLVVNSAGSSYTWYGPNGLISGANDKSYHPMELGEYYATYTINGCTSDPSNVLSISLLGVDDYNLDQVKIYPNPTSGEVMLDWGGHAVNAQIDVFTTIGQHLVHEEIANQSSKKLDLSNLASGIYFVVLKDDAGNTGTVRITLTK